MNSSANNNTNSVSTNSTGGAGKPSGVDCICSTGGTGNTGKTGGTGKPTKTNNNPEFKHPPVGRFFLTLLLFLMAQAIFVALGYLIAGLLFQLTGTPDQIVVVLVSAAIGIVLLIIVFTTVTHIKGAKMQKGHMGFGQDILDALESISQGNFDVVVNSDFRNPLADLADSVNKMARELGTMEQQRQEFISNVSHEIQSPLTSIHGFATLLKNPDLPEPDRLHYLEIIETESQRLSKLADSLLRLSVLDSDTSTNPQQYRLDNQLQSVALMLEPHWNSKQILLEEEAQEIEIYADKDMLDQVWINLLQNAIKFTPNGGSIKIRLWQNQDWAVCEIQDSGIGIAHADLPHIFERFYRADKARERAQGGNGLGLALVKRIVELHGGNISVNSQTEQGSTFTVSLPID